MGRTLHYEVVGRISDDEWDLIDDLQDTYNIKHRWTCEHLGLTRIPYWYPRWPNWFKDSKLEKGITSDRAWEIVSFHLDGLKGVKLERKVLELVESGILVLGEAHKQGIAASGLTKVADNEWNAKLIADFLIEASRIAPGTKFKLFDEGDYILCRYVFIEKGIVSRNMEKIQEHLSFLEEKAKDPKWEAYFTRCLMKFKDNLLLAEKGKYFADLDPSEYQDHPLFRTLTVDIGAKYG